MINWFCFNKITLMASFVNYQSKILIKLVIRFSRVQNEQSMEQVFESFLLKLNDGGFDIPVTDYEINHWYMLDLSWNRHLIS